MPLQTADMTAPPPPGQTSTLADHIIAQAEAGQFPKPFMVLNKLQGGDFELGGLNFTFSRRKQTQGTALSCSTLVGYLPYTAEARIKRQALTDILAATVPLRCARFTLDRQNSIHLRTEVPLSPEADDCDVIMAFLDFYREARPFLQLIAQHL